MGGTCWIKYSYYCYCIDFGVISVTIAHRGIEIHSCVYTSPIFSIHVFLGRLAAGVGSV